jgi:hypothetical protein
LKLLEYRESSGRLKDALGLSKTPFTVFYRKEKPCKEFSFTLVFEWLVEKECLSFHSVNGFRIALGDFKHYRLYVN